MIQPISTIDTRARNTISHLNERFITGDGYLEWCPKVVVKNEDTQILFTKKRLFVDPTLKDTRSSLSNMTRLGIDDYVF